MMKIILDNPFLYFTRLPLNQIELVVTDFHCTKFKEIRNLTLVELASRTNGLYFKVNHNALPYLEEYLLSVLHNPNQLTPRWEFIPDVGIKWWSNELEKYVETIYFKGVTPNDDA